MYNGVVADGDIVADDGLGFLVSGVDDDTILDVDFTADADAVDIAAYDGIEPDAGPVTDLDISDHGGIGGDKAIISKFREFAFDGEDSGHGNAFSLCKYP